jgi:hypothetical protein
VRQEIYEAFVHLIDLIPSIAGYVQIPSPILIITQRPPNSSLSPHPSILLMQNAPLKSISKDDQMRKNAIL